MSYQGRSLDDLPLAAYSRGTVEEEPEEEVVEQPHLSQQDAVAMAMGMQPAPKAEPEPAASSSGNGEGRGPSVPRMSLPRFSLPKLPRLSLRSRPAVAAESPFHVSAQPAMAIAHMPAAPPPAAHASGMPAPAGVSARRRGPSLGDLSGLGTTLRNPRTAVREPRVLFGGMIAIGVVLVGMSLLGGGSGGPGPGASATAPAGAVATAGPGAATVEVSGRVNDLFTLTGSAGFGRPAGGDLASTWSDAFSGTALSITGRVGSGTRTTASDLVLSVTVLVDGAPVTFVSQAGECTVGMAEKVFSVNGSFVCGQVTSADGRVKLKITGSYQT